MITALLKKSFLESQKRKYPKGISEYGIDIIDVEAHSGEELKKYFPEQVKMIPIFPNTQDDELDQYYSLDVKKSFEQIFLDFLNSRDEIESVYIKPPEGVPG